MKKLFSTILFLSFLLSGNAFAETYTVSVSGYYDDSKQTFTQNSKISLEDAKNKAIDLCKQSKLMNKGKPESCLVYRIKIYDGWKKKKNEVVWSKETAKFEQSLKKQKIVEKQKEQDAIMFTIKDKREQCEAIGFKPETDKFADCVLRLVELDVKKQQDQKIASAKSSGNLEVANQLLQMRNDNSSRYLMDLGQQLLNPRKTNSNIYMPQTQRCTIQGFGSFAKMVCR